jgi:hypothetical protein
VIRDRSAESLALLLSTVFLAFHLPYLPSSLEDLDSINFALGMRHFDVAQHQPHPPGYPVFILIARAARAATSSEAAALGLLSAIAGALGVLAIAALVRRCDGGSSNAWTLAATGVAMTSPLYWFTAVRPLSDMSGLAAALAVQALTLAAGTTRELAIAAFGAGIASGLRSQVAWLTLPLLIVRGLGGWGAGGLEGTENKEGKTHVASRPERAGHRDSATAVVPQPPSPLGPMTAAFAAGVLVWFLPLIAITGGPAAYWRALSNQGAEDLGNISMLWTTHTVRAVSDALFYAFVAPWAAWPMAVAMLAAAAAGIGWAVRHNRGALMVLAAAFGPYAAFDLLFQETFTSRYALPLVVPVAYLAALGLRSIPRNLGLVVAAAIAMFDAHVGGTSVAAYARQKAPAFRLLDDMAAAARVDATPPVLAMDRKNAFDFRRPLVWMDGAMPHVAQQLAAPAQHEWLEPVKYWNGGGRAPVWFVVDPRRTSIDLVQHGDPMPYRWPLAYPALLSGARPDEMDWYRVDRPEWYVGEGWSLTPESAGVADADTRGPASAPIEAWLSRDVFGSAERSALRTGVVMFGGRNFDRSRETRLVVEVGGRTVIDGTPPPGSFLRMLPLPVEAAVADYSPLTIRATPGSRVAIEQFDASSRRPLIGFGDGWHEQEFNPRTGLRWRWLSERGVIQLRAAMTFNVDIVTSSTPITLHVEGESPLKYFDRPSVLTIRTGDRVVSTQTLDSDFSFDVPGLSTGFVTFETNQIYVPAERSSRTQDRRHLGLRIFRCEIRPTSLRPAGRPF